MASGQLGSAVRQMGRLFTSGSVSGFSEADLLTRFVESKDETAFEALVLRFGPMVLGVCRQSLSNDPHAVDDAFQATFLVLVRRAHTVRDPALLGNWLYGVAVKVAKRARAETRKRQDREKRGAEKMSGPVGDLHGVGDPDLGPLLHEELARLPQKYRLPVLLCFLDGHTHEHAAELLGWPLGTVKGRLARAKELLRRRLSRRGLTASTAVLASTLTETARASVPPLLLDHTVKAAIGIAAGGAAAVGLSSAGAYALSEGVVMTMATTKLKVLIAGAITLAISLTGASVYARFGEGRIPAQDGQTAVKQTAKPSAPTSPTPGATPSTTDAQAIAADTDPLAEILKSEPAVGELPPMKELARRRLEAATQRLAAQAAHYENGTITIDRYLDSARQYMAARMEVAQDPDERIRAAEENTRVMRAIFKREKEKFEVGVGALPNLAEVALDLTEAEITLAKMRGGESTPARLGSSATIEEDSVDRAQNEKIRELLNKPLSLPFAQETPLGDVVKYLQSATVCPDFEAGIPIYVDPAGLTEAEKTMDSPISLNLEGVKARTGLRLLLKQLDLGYFIREGFVTITHLDSEDYKDATSPGWRERERLEEERREKAELDRKTRLKAVGIEEPPGFK